MSRIITVNASKKYNCIIDRGLIPRAGSLIKEVLPKASKLLVVSDSNVYPLHFPVLKESLLKEGYEVYEYVFEAGERSKNIESIAGMWEVMAEAGFTRTAVVCSDFGPYTVGSRSMFLKGGEIDETGNCVLIDPTKKHKAWVKAITRLAKNPELIKKLQDNMYEHVKERYNINKVTTDRANWYKEIVKK